MAQIKKILSIDGGGIKGLFPAAFLASIEKHLNRPLWEYFDLIVGTSTGGIIALALGLGLKAEEIKNLYLELGDSIFPKSRWSSKIRRLWTPKYDPANLKAALQTTLGDHKLGDSNTRLVIPALDGVRNRVHVYKTRHHPRFEKDWAERMVDVALSTSAAPTYFPAHITENGNFLVDGGMWANNPLGVAAVEGVTVLDWPRDSICALSIGCTSHPVDPSYPGFWRPLKLAGHIRAQFMMGQSWGSLGTASLLIGHENIKRIDPVAPTGRYKLDSTDRLNELVALAESEAREALPFLRAQFFDLPAEKFEPFPLDPQS
jgi:predicted acylesterase/phospholipase RssA